MLIDCPFSWHSRRIIAFAFFAFFFTQGAIAEHGIGPAYLPSENAFQGTKIDSILVSAESRNAPFPVISLPVVTDISNKEAPRQVGFARAIPDAYQNGIDSRQLRWKPVPKGGYVTSLAIKSPGAQALRVRLDVIPDIERLEIRFFSPDQAIGEGVRNFV